VTATSSRDASSSPSDPQGGPLSRVTGKLRRQAAVDRDLDTRHGLREVGVALGYFFLAHNLKIQADVRDLHDETPGVPDRDTMEYRAQFQAIF
jgi:hypothetical protein